MEPTLRERNPNNDNEKNQASNAGNHIQYGGQPLRHRETHLNEPRDSRNHGDRTDNPEVPPIERPRLSRWLDRSTQLVVEPHHSNVPA